MRCARDIRGTLGAMFLSCPVTSYESLNLSGLVEAKTPFGQRMAELSKIAFDGREA
jgi:hypothetical protein